MAPDALRRPRRDDGVVDGDRRGRHRSSSRRDRGVEEPVRCREGQTRRDHHLDRSIADGLVVRLRDDRGEMVISNMLAIPLLWLGVMTVVQLGLFGYAHNLANTAARQAAQVASLDGSSSGDGAQVGRDFVSGTALWQSPPTVSVVRGDDQTVVIITGQVFEIFPTPWDTVTAEASAPTEQFVPAR